MSRVFLIVSVMWMLGTAHGQTFHGDDCTEDCSGHEAGYEWAEDNDIDDVDDCSGNSNSFNEGCESYVEENYNEDEGEY